MELMWHKIWALLLIFTQVLFKRKSIFNKFSFYSVLFTYIVKEPYFGMKTYFELPFTKFDKPHAYALIHIYQ